MTSSPNLRVGDSERAAVADRLAAHAAAGRLGVEELEHRLERAHAAVHQRELDTLLTDLPEPGAARWPQAGRAAGGRRQARGAWGGPQAPGAWGAPRARGAWGRPPARAPGAGVLAAWPGPWGGRPPLALLGLALAATVALSLLAGHPLPPVFFALVFLWRWFA